MRHWHFSTLATTTSLASHVPLAPQQQALALVLAARTAGQRQGLGWWTTRQPHAPLVSNASNHAFHKSHQSFPRSRSSLPSLLPNLAEHYPSDSIACVIVQVHVSSQPEYSTECAAWRWPTAGLLLMLQHVVAQNCRTSSLV